MGVEALESAWLSHCYDGFPRSFGIPEQYPVADKAEFLREAWRYFGTANIYTSVHSFAQQEARTYTKIYIDIDSVAPHGTPELILAKAITSQFTIMLNQLFGHNPRVYFSGRKGFAIYIDFAPTFLSSYQFVARRFVQQMLFILGYGFQPSIEDFDNYAYHDCIDVGVFEPARISRVPYTSHIKGKAMCRPLNESDLLYKGVSELFRSRAPQEIEHETFGADLVSLLQRYDTVDYKRYSELRADILRKVPSVENPDLNADLETLLWLAPHFSDGRHRIVYAFVLPRTIMLGWDDPQIWAYCKDLVEASGGEFNYQWNAYLNSNIRTCRRKGVIPWKWETFFHHYPDMRKIFKSAEDKANGNVFKLTEDKMNGSG